jgi:3-oxoacyl-[acyl-carrier protein] reductase
MRGPIRTPTEQEQSMSDLKGKVAIVTGASKGIGASIAKNLAAAGAAVAVNYASSREGAERVVADIKVSGGKAIAVKGDVAKAADVRRLFEETRSAFGGVDILVNNAGIYHFQPLEDITEDEFHLQFNTNVLGTILAAKEAAKHFGPDGGSIINISSVASEQAQPTATVYSATKGAVDTLTRVLAAELGQRKIRVNAIAPAGWRPRAPTPPVSSAAISRRTWWRAPRSAGSASPMISPASPCFWPPTTPPGSPASGSPRRAGITETRRAE